MSSKTYKEEDLYKIVLAVEKHPGQSAVSVNFWNVMINKHGGIYWGERSAEALRTKWRKIKAEHGENLLQYKESLESGIPKDLVETLGKRRAKSPTPRKQLGSGSVSKQSSTKKQEKAKEEQKLTGKRRNRLEDLLEEEPTSEIEVKTGAGKARLISSIAEASEKKLLGKTQLKEYIGAKKEESKRKFISKDLLTHNITSHDLNQFGTEKELLLFQKVHDKLEAFSFQFGLSFQQICIKLEQASGDLNALLRGLQGEEIQGFSELEDLALKQHETTDMFQYIARHKGKEVVLRRKKYLGVN